MGLRIDEAELVQALDRRVRPTLPTEWPGGDAWPVRSASVSDHFDYASLLDISADSREEAVTQVAQEATWALIAYSDGVSEDAREPYNGSVTIDGDLLRVRFGRVPRSTPDDGDLSPELDPIPLGDILIDE